MSIFDLFMNRGGSRAEYGDLVYVARSSLGESFGVDIYDHYGIYESDSCIYEYGADSFVPADAVVRTVTLSEFIGSSDPDSFRVMRFPDADGDDPADADTSWDSPDKYHIYSPKAAVRRARSRLGTGRGEYNIRTNNCEHFARWCKTGVRQSPQADKAEGVLKDAVKTAATAAAALAAAFIVKKMLGGSDRRGGEV